jgi:hypothetical protein
MALEADDKEEEEGFQIKARSFGLKISIYILPKENKICFRSCGSV